MTVKDDVLAQVDRAEASLRWLSEPDARMVATLLATIYWLAGRASVPNGLEA